MNCQEDFENILSDHGYSKLKILSRRRQAWIVDQRQIIAKKLRRMGYSFPQIGKVMNRDHTSILHLCNKRQLLKLTHEAT